jgi:hypothetical protein
LELCLHIDLVQDSFPPGKFDSLAALTLPATRDDSGMMLAADLTECVLSNVAFRLANSGPIANMETR